MKYKVVPFTANISSEAGSKADAAASQLESLITSHGDQGWEFMQLETVETHVAGSAGCFGLGATPGYATSYSMAVFRK